VASTRDHQASSLISSTRLAGPEPYRPDHRVRPLSRRVHLDSAAPSGPIPIVDTPR
jgi:hypothetical protein